MGYTHYWTFRKTDKIKGEAQKVEELYQKAIKDCHKVILAYYKDNKGTYSSLSGYSAHTKLGQYGGIQFNGKGKNAHEDFYLREHFKQNFEGFGSGFHFCKTAHKPYDIVVTACLSILSYRLGKYIEVSSDGLGHDWIDGINLAEKVLKLKIAKKILKSKVEHPINLGDSNLKVV